LKGRNTVWSRCERKDKKKSVQEVQDRCEGQTCQFGNQSMILDESYYFFFIASFQNSLLALSRCCFFLMKKQLICNGKVCYCKSVNFPLPQPQGLVTIFIFFPSILPSYGTAGSMIPRYLFCLFLCTTATPTGFSIYIFINTTVTFIESSGHSVQMS
jgi:hypothetical protein